MGSVLTYAMAPRAVMVALVFVTIFLLSFVMVGCMHGGDTFSSIYLVRFEYNTASPFFEYIENSFNSSQNPNGAYISVKTGIMGICTTLEDDTLCTGQNFRRFNASEISPVANFSIYGGNQSHELGSFNLLKMATSFSTKSMYGLLMAVLICLGGAFASLIFVTFFLVKADNWKNLVAYYGTGLALIFSLVSNLTMYTASHTTKSTVEQASLGLVAVTVGRKAAMMYWSAFALIMLSCILIMPVNQRTIDECVLEEKKASERV